MSSAKKKANGHDASAQIIAVLERIEGELKITNARLDITNARLDSLRGDLTALGRQVTATNERLDTFQQQAHEDTGELKSEVTATKNELRGLRVEAMADRADVVERLEKLEAVVFKRTGT